MNTLTLVKLPNHDPCHDEDLTSLIYIEGTPEHPSVSCEMKLVCVGGSKILTKLYEFHRSKLSNHISKIILTHFYESTMGSMMKTPFINKNHPTAGPWSASGVMKMLQVPQLFLGGNQNLRSRIATAMDTNTQDKVVVSAMGYKPYSIMTPSTQTFINDKGQRVLNTFVGSDITPADAMTALPFVEHVEYLCDQDIEQTKHLLDWLAYTTQFPAKKIGHAVLLGSRKGGTGKSLLLNTLATIMGRTNVSTINVRDLHNSKQDWLINKILVIVEEVKDLNLSDMNNLKTLITEPFVMADKKFGSYQQESNYANFMFTSNFERSLYLPDSANARRYFIVFSEQEPKSALYYRSLATWLDHEDGYGKVLAFLLERDLSGFNAMEPPPETAAKTKLMAGSKTDFELYLGQWANGIHDGNEQAVPKAFTYEQLQCALQVSPYQSQRGKTKRISEFLSSAGCIKKRIYIAPGKTKAVWFNQLAVQEDMANWPYDLLIRMLDNETSAF